MEKLRDYIMQKFGVDTDKFIEVLRMSPGAEGYLLGSLSELLFKEHANGLGYDALRIKEKPAGGYNAKNEEARGDFYIKRKDDKTDNWFVVECKGVKSNSEKRAGLTNKEKVLKFIKKHSEDREQYLNSILSSGQRNYDSIKKKWEKKTKKKFPKFRWNQTNPGAGLPDLSHLWKTEGEIKVWLENFNNDSFHEQAYWNLMSPLRLIQTHMPSPKIDPITKIKSTGPLTTDFNILCVDLFLRTGEHEFVFANSTELNHQAKSPNHLQQNYTIDILVEKDSFARHALLEPWYNNLDECIKKTNPKPQKIDESQLDTR